MGPERRRRTPVPEERQLLSVQAPSLWLRLVVGTAPCLHKVHPLLWTFGPIRLYYPDSLARLYHPDFIAAEYGHVLHFCQKKHEPHDVCCFQSWAFTPLVCLLHALLPLRLAGIWTRQRDSADTDNALGQDQQTPLRIQPTEGQIWPCLSFEYCLGFLLLQCTWSRAGVLISEPL